MLLTCCFLGLPQGSATVYYLLLDIKESECLTLSRKPWKDCEPTVSRVLPDIVMGQCKVIVTRNSSDSQDLRLEDFNCTKSSVSSALFNNKDSPVIADFFEDAEPYRNKADQALEKYKERNDGFASFRVNQVEKVTRERGGERTNYYVEFSVRNCSRHHFHRHPKVFGFCRAVLSYDAEDSDFETPKELDVNCEVFDTEDRRNMSGVHLHPCHHPHFGGHGHFPGGRPPFKPHGARGHHHRPHELGCPPPLEGKDPSGRPPFQGEEPPRFPPPGSRCHHNPVGTNGFHDHSSNEHHPHKHHPHGQHPHRHRPRGHGPRGHHPHGHHPCGQDFHCEGSCDPTLQSQDPQDHHHHGHGPPHRHSEGKGPGNRHFPFHCRPIGYVYQLPPLKTGEVLPLPEANFPSLSLPNHSNPLKPFPRSPSELCPGKFQTEFLHVSKFFSAK
ncbi:histidine-rich glycoprotein [Otolemur garnettii]|nr:histidine-rich glycoprotein [Otolemur garnettii]